jgi:uncharacterized protein YbcI
VYASHYGQEPAHVDTYIAEDFIFCVLTSPFTTAERSLLKLGDYEAVRVARRAFEDAMTEHFMMVVSDIVGVEVIAYMSQICAKPELSIDVFQLKDPHKPDWFELG